MSLEQEYPNRLERKKGQFDMIKRLVHDQLPKELSKVLKKEDRDFFVLGKGSDRAIEIFISDFTKSWDNSTYMLYVREFDLRKYSNVYMMDLVKYLPEEELLILDVTSEKLDDEMKLFTLESEDIHNGGLVMLRDQQVELERDMYDECYYFLVSVK
jgi:hypothetical protein